MLALLLRQTIWVTSIIPTLCQSHSTHRDGRLRGGWLLLLLKRAMFAPLSLISFCSSEPSQQRWYRIHRSLFRLSSSNLGWTLCFSCFVPSSSPTFWIIQALSLTAATNISAHTGQQITRHPITRSPEDRYSGWTSLRFKACTSGAGQPEVGRSPSNAGQREVAKCQALGSSSTRIHRSQYRRSRPAPGSGHSSLPLHIDIETVHCH